jgi:hypothetical protein
MSLCPTCNSEMKLIPPGVSKSTGRPYSAFEACPKNCPKNNPRAVTYAPLPSQTTTTKDEWNQIRDQKETAIHWAVCLKGAIDLCVAGKCEKDQIHTVACWLYGLTPPASKPF